MNNLNALDIPTEELAYALEYLCDEEHDGIGLQIGVWVSRRWLLTHAAARLRGLTEANNDCKL